MQIIMGGSGSTGSSLLKNILNRNQAVFAGGETAFFAKKMIYENWQKAKRRVLKRKFKGLRNHGWHMYNGTDLLQSEYGWKQMDLSAALERSDSLMAFTSEFYSKPMDLTGAYLWLEKTPANSACFSFFLNSFEDGKAIHMVRNPFDTIASLTHRGYNLYYAVGIYLINTACGIASQKSNRVYTIKYEDLIAQPELMVRELCAFLEIKYSDSMLEPQGEKIELSKLKGWNYDETQSIGKEAVGRFNKLTDEAQDRILEAVNIIQMNETGRSYYNTNIDSIEGICTELGYDFYNIGKRNVYSDLKAMKLRDRMARVRRGYPSGIYYPIELRK